MEETKESIGEFWEDWIEKDKQEKEHIKELIEKRKQEAKAREEEYLEMRNKELEDMQKRYNFALSNDLVPALERLESLKVNEYRLRDYSYQDSFDKVWASVLHEVDMYEEGEESPMNKTTVKGAKNWLKSFSHLYKGKIPEEYKTKEV